MLHIRLKVAKDILRIRLKIAYFSNKRAIRCFGASEDTGILVQVPHHRLGFCIWAASPACYDCYTSLASYQ